MFLGFLVAPMASAELPPPEAGALASVGEALGETVVAGVEVHPEYERYSLRLADGRIAVAEVTRGDEGLCDVDGLTIFPRADLSGVNETTGMAELCARMTGADGPARRPDLRARIGPSGTEVGDVRQPGDLVEGRPPAPDGAPATTVAPSDPPAASASPSPGDTHGVAHVRPTHVLLALLALLALPRIRVDRTLAVVTATSIAARLWASPHGVGNGNLAGYEKLLLARGTLLNPPYGEGWGALMGFVPGWPDGVFVADLVFAALAAPLLAAIVRRLAGDRAGLAAGLFLALLPTHVGVSFTETMHVPVLTFELVAVLAAVTFAQTEAFGAALLGVVGTLLAWAIRPDALPFAIVPVAAWLFAASPPRRELLWRGVVLAVAAAFFVRLGLGVAQSPQADILRVPDLRVLLPRIGVPDAQGSFQLFWHAGFTPPVLWALVAGGCASLVRDRRLPLLAVLLGWAVVTTLPFSAKVWPLVDAVRLQLTGQAAWVALAAIGASALPRWVLPVALLTMLPYLPVRPWVQTEEWRFLRANVPDLPAGTTVRYEGRAQRSLAFAAVMEHIGPARWSRDEGDVRYVGLDCLSAPVSPGSACDTSACVAWRVARLTGRADLDLPLRERTIGLWKCGDTAATGAEDAAGEEP